MILGDYCFNMYPRKVFATFTPEDSLHNREAHMTHVVNFMWILLHKGDLRCIYEHNLRPLRNQEGIKDNIFTT